MDACWPPTTAPRTLPRERRMLPTLTRVSIMRCRRDRWSWRWQLFVRVESV